jgi:hypothetical protein
MRIYLGLALTLLLSQANAETTPAAQTPAKKTPMSQSPFQAGRPALKVRPEGDQAIKRTVADAMGFVRGMGAVESTKTLNRIQWLGSGKMVAGTTTYDVTKYSYTVSLHLKSAREDIQRKSGAKVERLVQVVVDKDAWDEKEPGVDGRKASDSALNRQLRLARTAIGFTRAMLDADQTTVKVVDPGAGGKVTISFSIEGVQTTAELNADYRPETITMKVDGKTLVAHHRAYKDISEYGVMFPTHTTETIDGRPYLDLTIDDARVASYAVFPKPAFLEAH